MVSNGYQAFQGDHFVMYLDIRSLCCKPETNNIAHHLCFNKKCLHSPYVKKIQPLEIQSAIHCATETPKNLYFSSNSRHKVFSDGHSALIPPPPTKIIAKFNCLSQKLEGRETWHFNRVEKHIHLSKNSLFLYVRQCELLSHI